MAFSTVVRKTLASAGALGLLCVSACSGAGLGAAASTTIRVGVDLPLSGPEGAAGLQALNGVRFFVQQHARIDDYAVALAVADDAGGKAPDPQLGAANVAGFAADASVVAVIGPFDSAVARQEIPIANAASLAMISPAASSPCLTQDLYLPAALNPYRTPITCKVAGLPSASELRPSHVNNFFRLAGTDALQGPAAADYAFKTLKVLRAAVVSDHEAYGQALAAAFTARFQHLGGSVVGHLDVGTTAGADATGFLKEMKAAGATAVYYGGSTATQGCAIRAQMSGIFDPGAATPFLTGDGIADDPGCVLAAGSNSAGILATVPAAIGATSPAAIQAVAGFRTAFGRTEDYGPYTLLAVDSAAVVYAALDRAIHAAGDQVPERGNVISQLSVTSEFAGATGSIGFDLAGDNTHPVVSIVEPTAADPRAQWTVVGSIDYSNALPY
ncbi:MAG: branched-chain amino acid ABC transporter substrate-binding protein [Candidatus Dormibacterales bacterium]